VTRIAEIRSFKGSSDERRQHSSSTQLKSDLRQRAVDLLQAAQRGVHEHVDLRNTNNVRQMTLNTWILSKHDADTRQKHGWEEQQQNERRRERTTQSKTPLTASGSKTATGAVWKAW
jgi:hypothetical protein